MDINWRRYPYGGLVAFVLAYTVPKKLNDDRALKDFFIDEMRTLKKNIMISVRICVWVK